MGRKDKGEGDSFMAGAVKGISAKHAKKSSGISKCLKKNISSVLRWVINMLHPGKLPLGFFK